MNTAYWRYASFALLGMAVAACQHSGTGKPSLPKPPAKAPAAAAPSAPQPQAPASAPASPPVFRAALLAPFSGRHAEFGAAMLNAAQLALYDAAGEDFVLMPLDTRGSPGGAVEAARQSVQRGAGAMLGPIFGSNVSAAAEAVRARSLPVFAFSNDRAALRPGVWLFGPLPEDEVERLVGHAAAEGRKRLGLLGYDTEFGRYAMQAAERAARRHGVTVVRRGTISPGLDAKALSERVRVFAGAPARRTPETEERPPPFDAVLIAAEGEALRSTAALLAFHGIDPKLARYLATGVRPDRLPLDEPSLEGAWYAGPPPEAFDSLLPPLRSRLRRPAAPSGRACLRRNRHSRHAGGEPARGRTGCRSAYRPGRFLRRGRLLPVPAGRRNPAGARHIRDRARRPPHRRSRPRSLRR